MEKLEARQQQVREELVSRIDAVEERATKALDKHTTSVLESVNRLEIRIADIARADV